MRKTVRGKMTVGHQQDLSDYLKSWDKLGRYSQWLFNLYSSHIGKRCLDIGGGIGTSISYYIDKVDQVIATELFEDDVAIMNRRFSDIPYFKAIRFDIMKDDINILREYHPDTVICINCLEHIKDDVRAMSLMGEVLSSDGKIIICVPAMNDLYCYIDKNVGHYRRYTRGELAKKAKEAELAVIDNYYMNLMGILPYWIKGRFGKPKDMSFSSSITVGESKLYSIATTLLEPIERIIRPPAGVSEFIILRKKCPY